MTKEQYLICEKIQKCADIDTAAKKLGYPDYHVMRDKIEGRWVSLDWDGKKVYLTAAGQRALKDYKFSHCIRVIAWILAIITVLSILLSLMKQNFFKKTEISSALNSDESTYSLETQQKNSGKWVGKSVLVIGDSTSDPPYGDTPWQTTFAEELNVNVTSHAKAGATLMDMIDGNDRLGISALTEQDVDSKDLIILWGGANDALQGVPVGEVGDKTTETICGRFSYVVNVIYDLLNRANNNECRLVMLSYYSTSLNEDSAASQATEDIAHNLGLPCLNLYKKSGINWRTYELYVHEDNMHLNSEGNALIGKQIALFVNDEL